MSTADEICQDFATRHDLYYTTRGSCGFGRPCVGFGRRNETGDQFIDFNPIDMADPEYKRFPEYDCGTLVAPPHDLVPDAYHKHDCMAVLVHCAGDEPTPEETERALKQLAAWVQYLEQHGQDKVHVVTYSRGLQHPLQRAISGDVGYAVVVRP